MVHLYILFWLSTLLLNKNIPHPRKSHLGCKLYIFVLCVNCTSSEKNTTFCILLLSTTKPFIFLLLNTVYYFFFIIFFFFTKLPVTFFPWCILLQKYCQSVIFIQLKTFHEHAETTWSFCVTHDMWQVSALPAADLPGATTWS